MPIAAVLRPAADRRARHRHQLRLDACLDAEGLHIPCVIADVSAGGARLVAELPADLATVRLEIEAFDIFDCRVVWRDDTHVGVEFINDPDQVTRRLSALIGSG